MEVVGALEWIKARATPDIRVIIPSRRAWRASLIHDSNLVENYLLLSRPGGADVSPTAWAVAWDELSASAQLLASVSVGEWL